MILEDTLLTGKEFIKHAANIGEKHTQGRYGVKNIPSALACDEVIEATYNRIMSGGELEINMQSIPSDEWIADNYHIVREAADALALEDFKKKHLPVYDIATEIAAHTDGLVGEREILDFVASYEKVRPLDTESLGCLCSMLKLALVKRIAEICKMSDKIHKDRKEAEKIFKEFASYTSKEDGQQMRSATVLFENEDMISPVFAETVLRLSAEQEQNEAARLALSGKLAARGTTIEELIEREHKTRISLSVSMGNAIRSLQGLPSLDWDTIMSKLCVAEQILRKDPVGVFPKMTTKSRSEYLRIVQVCAKRHHTSPEKYTLKVLEKAQKEQTHVGKFIYEDYTKHNDFGAFFVMFLFTSAILAFCPAVYTFKLGMENYGIFGILLALFCVLLILLISMNVSLSLIQKMYMDKKMPFSLPEMDFSGKLPADCKIMIVLPCLINDKKRVDEMVKQLEAAYWANSQDGICYTLLADLSESTAKTTQEDSEIIKYAQKEVKKLQKRIFPSDDKSVPERFFVLIRQRDYYKEDNKWMGAERKRGAIIELNRAIINGELPKVNYVLTVDADTVIPINTAVKMAQIMHHPLNKPEISYVEGEPIVTKGYALLQPSVKSSGLGREKSTLFEKIYSSDSGFDSYASKTSDFYFDVCHEGIYTGKGMYDPYVFNGLLDGRFKKNSILSHDLLEGSFVRTAFVSDVPLYDNFPRTYAGYVKREHRWIRGDWQLLPFLGKSFENEKGVLKNNPLNFYSRFKIFINLIRSLLPVALFLLFVVGMLLLRRDAFLWIFILAGTLLVSAGGNFVSRIRKAFCDFLLLPHTFYYHTDAIVRAVYRTFFSRKNMLEWVVSAETDKKIQNLPVYYCRTMWINFVSAALVSPFLFGIVSVLWIFTPYAVYFSSRKSPVEQQKLSPEQIKKFRITARKIWAFYEDYAIESENYLPPDNVQFAPVYCVAHRTSPTNIGFLIVSTVIAGRMGYISQGEVLLRLENIVKTLERLKKWNGHIFNWYDTLTLDVLEPGYISCVDSGNLAACLLTASRLTESFAENDSIEKYIKRSAEGLLDTIFCLNEIADKDSQIETNVLEEFLAKCDFSADLKEEFLKIIRYYVSVADFVKNEKADAHSLRYKIKDSLSEIEQNLKSEVIDIQTQSINVTKKLTKLALEMDFGVLYDSQHRHLCIGYNYSRGEFSASYYDMLMSEARLTSYIAMAKGDVESEHFSALARRFNKDGSVLLSWSGTVFEYLLPELFMPSPYDSSLYYSIYGMLDIQQKAVTDRPWGISESGYNAFDVNMNYKYRAFGLKSLAVKRMHNDDAVVAPYAAIMASKQIPNEAYKNMLLFTRLGAEGKYGYYEAVDFTPGRKGIVESFMAHHVGMSLCGIANLLFDGMVSKGFAEMPMMKAVEVMLTEKMPKKKKPKKEIIRKPNQQKNFYVVQNKEKEEIQQEYTINLSGNDTEVLSNGKYSLIINGQGNSYSEYCGTGLDVYRENIETEGVVLYLNGQMLKPAKCTIHSASCEFLYLTESAEITQTVCVSAGENAEMRVVKITNKGKTERYDNLTVYIRLMLNKKTSYEAHPSYSSMFVTTDVIKNEKSELCLGAYRRKHTPSDANVQSYFYVNVPFEHKNKVESLMYDTDVLSFKGRNHNTEKPMVFESTGSESEVLLAGNVGAVLNPCYAVNLKLRVEAGGSTEVSFAMGVCEEKNEILEKTAALSNTERVFELARTRSLIEKEHISFKKGDLEYFRSFASKLLYGRKKYSRETQQKLWEFGISGDNPIITVMLKKPENAVRVEKLVRMWCFYSFRGIKLDLVLTVFDDSDYISPIHELADNLVQRGMWGCFPVRGNIFVIAPQNSDGAVPVIEASNLVFWL
ncbi:MAG: hypothetical protein E7387_03615 [Ruminococcaceae bacterium]|nr:hypothetical protein [Oscillospiraceae bacterium]